MIQKTIKIPVEPIENELLKGILKTKGFDFKDHQYAYFRAQNGKITVILYKNQNLLLQGDEKEVDSFFGFLNESLTFNRVELDVLGLDESGKGDLFGPLVLAGVIIKKHDSFIEKAGVEDSKNLSDNKIKEIFDSLRDKIIFKVRVIEPEEYNKLYENYKNLNKLMINEYKELIKSFDEKDYKKIVLDKFSLSRLQMEEIKSNLSKPIEIYVRAERHFSVALASIVARYYFLEWFEKNNLPLMKGCSTEVVDFFNKLKKTQTHKELRKFAKLHFKI